MVIQVREEVLDGEDDSRRDKSDVGGASSARSSGVT